MKIKNILYHYLTLISLFILFFILPINNLKAEKPIFVTTIYPAAAILNEIVKPNFEVNVIIPVGASPHTFAPKPSDIKKAYGALALIYVDESLDGWASAIASKNKIKLMDLLPKKFHRYYDGCGHDHGNNHDDHGHTLDPHFWTDPLTVKALVPILADTLAKLDPKNASIYLNNADLFISKLDMLHLQIGQLLKELRGKTVFLFHPAFLYMLERYNLVYAGSIEEIPGKEISPRQLASLVQSIKQSGTKAVFSEPQLPQRPAELIAKEANVMLYELDPNGGTKGRMSYSDLILYNARTLRRALN